MDFQKIFEGLGVERPFDPLEFTEHDGIVNYGKGDGVHVGELVCDYANLLIKRNDEMGIFTIETDLSQCLSNGGKWPDLYDVARKFGGHAFAWSILMLLYESRYKSSDHFIWVLVDISKRCRRYVKGGRLKTVGAGVELEAHIFTGKAGNLQIKYSSRSAEAVAYYHILRLQELGQRPNICKVCGRAFIPVSKSNEMYCRRKNSDGRTCADIAFENRTREDPFYSLYRTAYKTMSARAARMEGGGKDRLTRWRTEAKKKYDEYKEADDLEGLSRWIEDSMK